MAPHVEGHDHVAARNQGAGEIGPPVLAGVEVMDEYHRGGAVAVAAPSEDGAIGCDKREVERTLRLIGRAARGQQD